nr:hypothetical protein [Tanacetum cinerariifolium]
SGLSPISSLEKLLSELIHGILNFSGFQQDKPTWFKKPHRPKTLDPGWNKDRTVNDGLEQTWFNDLEKVAKNPVEFDDLIGSTIDFSNFIKHRLKIDKITKSELEGPIFKLLKGDRCPYDLSKPLHLQGPPGHLTIPIDFFLNNDLEYLKTRNKERKYGYLEEIVVRRADQKLYKFKEGDFPRLHLNDIEDMLLLYVRNKLFNLEVSASNSTAIGDLCDPIWIKLVTTGYRFGLVNELTTQLVGPYRTGDRLGLVSDRLAELTPSFRGVKKSNKHDEANVVQHKCKLGDGYFTAAIKVLTSSGIVPSTLDTLHELDAKHPYALPLTLSSSPFGVDAFSVYKNLVLNMIGSFPKGTSSGRDGLRAQHLMDILERVASVVAHDLLVSITEVVNMFLGGKCPSQLVEYIANAPLTPLVKPGGGIRPIVVGTVWRRLVSKVASSLIESKGTKFGSSMLLVDFKNAFNLVYMSILLEETRAWYLNDITIVGDTLIVAKALDIIMIDGLARELFLNVDKTELFWPVEDHRSRAGDVFPINVSRPLNGVKFLGASVSVHEGFCQDLALKRVSKTISLMEAFHKLHDPQCDLLILCNCVEVGKLSYALRTCSPMSLLVAQVQWRLATLPIKFGGLDILSAGDIICMLLMLSTLHVTPTYSLSPRQVAILCCIHALHAQDFLFTILIDGLGQRTNHRQFRFVLCYRLAVPIFSEGSICSSCNAHRKDQWGDHAVHCSSEVGVKFRPNLVRDIIFDICSKVGIMVCKEAPMGFLSDDGKDLRPTDLLLFNWLQGSYSQLHSCPRAQDFLFAIIIDGLGQRTNHRQFRSVLCYRLAVPIFSEGGLCSSCNAHRIDQRGDHAVHCSIEVGVRFRPNMVRDILVDICSKVGIMVCKEAPMGFLSDDGKDLRPVDLLLFN